MSLEIEAGYMRVTGTNGEVCLDTRNPMFHRITPKSGTVIVPHLDIGSGTAPKTRAQQHDLGAVAAGCTHVLGFCQIVYESGSAMLPSGYWFMVGGSIVSRIKRFQTTSGNNAKFISSMQLLTFELVGTTLVLNEETILCNDLEAGPNLSIAALTVNYRLWAGRFN